MIYIIILLLIFILVILIRTMRFVSPEISNKESNIVDIDNNKVINDLAKLVKCKTISYKDSSKEDNKEFEKLLKLIPKLYPNVYKKLEMKSFDARGILFSWPGKIHDEASVFMAHYDVVPVEEEFWSQKPFDANIVDGMMFGRGSIDTKLTFNGILEAANYLLEKGFIPEHDIYLAFSGCEEIYGPGATNIVNYLKDNNIKINFVLDEGGAVVEGVFPGVKEKCGMVGICEKGLADISLIARSNGGHASAPLPNSPIVELSKACKAIESHPFKRQLSIPTSMMFNTLGKHSTFLYRMIFANMWCFSWIIDLICKKQGGQLNALNRTTVAFTKMEGSEATNVIPPVASMTMNVRIAPGDTLDSVVAYLKKVINNPNIEIKVLSGNNPSNIASIENDGYKYIKEAIEETWTGTIVSPYLMVQCSDSRDYDIICDNVYKFSACDLDNIQVSSIHGNDEHIKVETIPKTVSFFIKVMERC